MNSIIVYESAIYVGTWVRSRTQLSDLAVSYASKFDVAAILKCCCNVARLIDRVDHYV